MRLTIVTEDRLIRINDEFLLGVEEDLSWIPNDVHAVQWYDDHGEVEYVDSRPNLELTSLGIYSQAIQTFENEKIRREQKRIQEELYAELARDYWNELRLIRNYLLNSCDWTVLPDAPLNEETRQLWMTYRQQLRDFPETVEDPKPYVNDFDRSSWPQPPA